MTVQDIDRPDVNGNLPKMHAIAEAIKPKLSGLAPYIKVACDDNFLSSVSIRGSFTPVEEWTNKIYYNSKHFRFTITTAKGKRYYEEGDQLTIELNTKDHTITKKFRKYIGTPEKVIAKIIDWIKA